MTENSMRGNPLEIRDRWTVLSRKEVYSNPYGLKVIEDEVIRPDGKPGSYSYVKIKSGVSDVPIDENNQVILIKSYIYPWKRYSLGCVSGGIEKGDKSPEERAMKELEEELGLIARKWNCLGEIQPSGLMDYTQTIFLARDLRQGKMNREATERMKIVRMPLESAIEKIGSEIRGGSSALALYMAMNFLKERA